MEGVLCWPSTPHSPTIPNSRINQSAFDFGRFGNEVLEQFWRTHELLGPSEDDVISMKKRKRQRNLVD